MENNQIRVVFIGAGAVNFGSADGLWDHASRLEKLNAKFVSIVDPAIERATEHLNKRKLNETFAHLWNDCQIFDSISQFLDSKLNVNAAFIGTPPGFRGCFEHPVELKLLEAGINLFIEKPLSVHKHPSQAELYAKKVEQLRVEKNLTIR
jgi:predicted dehydrogenase